MVRIPVGTRPAPPFARAGLWLLPVHAALLALSTLTHQPDPASAFGDYARYVTGGVFLASHLVASIVGAALGALGAVAAAAYLVRGPAARSAVVGAALIVAGNVVTAAVFGAAAFAQPAIGRAHLRGVADAPAIDADVYGPALVLTAVVGLLALGVGSVLLGRAAARAPGLRVAGTTYAVALPVFVVLGFTVELLQPLAALVAAVAAAVIALRLPSSPHEDLA